MIKILATSDWHLGNTFHGFDRQEEHADFLRWLLGVVEQKAPDALLVSGDIFDSSNPSAASQELYYSFLDTLTQRFPQLQTIIIAGNHDSAARLEAPRLMLERHRVYVRGLIRRQEEGNFLPDDLLLPVCSAAHPEERAWVLAVPYLRDGDFTRGMSYGEGVGEFLRRAVEAANLRRDRSREALILMAHLYATGSEIAENSSERIVIGGSEMVSLDEIDESVTLALLGHLHRNQKVSGRENWLYPGSALPMSFAEKGYRHGAVYYERRRACSVSGGECLARRSRGWHQQAGRGCPSVEKCAFVPDGNRLSGAAVGWRRGSSVGIGRRFADARPDRGDQKELSEQVPL